MSIARRIGTRIQGFLASLVPGASEARYRELNTEFWSRIAAWEERGRASDEYVLIEEQNHPIVSHCNASFAGIVCHARGLRPLFLLSHLRDASLRRVLSSYHPQAEFVYTNGPRYWAHWLWAAFEAVAAYRRLSSSSAILDFEIDGIRFGDIVYDNVLLFGYATIRKVDLRVLAVLYLFFLKRRVIRDLIGRYCLRTAVLSHNIGITGGVFCRYLLRAGVEVLNRSGSEEIIVKKYRKPEDAYFYSARPERRYFDWMMQLPEEQVLPLADEYLDERLNQKVKHIAVEMAFSKDKREYSEAKDFCARYGLDPRKRIVFVMLHAFNDHPHSHFARRLLYRDYFDWFERTLAVARSTESVNWVFKEHPAAEFYPTRDVDLEQIFSGERSSNVTFLDRNADFNARSIRHLAHAIVTCLGTAGLEYSCLGIPCVLAGESPYTGFGFTREPESIAAYEDALRHIEGIPRLSENQVKAAKVVMLFELPMIHGQPYLFCPHYEYRKIRTMQAAELWSDLAKSITIDRDAQLAEQVQVLTEFLRDPEYTQYLNLQRYGFMRGALSRGSATDDTPGGAT